MKRSLILLFVMVLTAGLAFGGVINVTQPSGGSFCIGNQLPIVWHETPHDHTQVKIRLFNSTGTTKILDITNDTANDGTFNWTIPNTVAPGQYTVRVKTLDNQESDESAIFTINDCSTPLGTINVATPANVAPGNNCAISWTSAGTVGSSVNIMLFNQAGTAQVYLIAHNTGNDGNHTWPVSGSFQTGTYRIKVENTDGTVSGISGTFNIGNTITFAPIEQQVHYIPRPDLKVSMTFDPVNPGVGQTTSVHFRVDNIGGDEAQPCVLRAYMGQTKTDSWNLPAIPKNGHQIRTKVLNPSGVGYIVWTVTADEDKLTSDVNRANNSKTTKMFTKGSDLIVCVSNGKRPAVGSSSTISVVVTNKGDYKSVPCKLRVYVKQKGVTWHDVPALDPGSKYRIQRKHTWGLSGTKKITASVDHYNVVKEKNENNNTVESSYFVRLPHHDKYAVNQNTIKCSDGTMPAEF